MLPEKLRNAAESHVRPSQRREALSHVLVGLLDQVLPSADELASLLADSKAAA